MCDPMSLHLIDETRIIPESSAPRPERVIAGSPKFQTWPGYESADGKHHAGLWRSTPGTWRITYTEWEYCEILDGISVVTDIDGKASTLVAGDKFVLEPGFDGTWQVVETTTKRYVVILP
jgi:uncharacterized cupin superfamily protein